MAKQPKPALVIRQAILTKYIPPANVRGSRVKATAQAGSVTVDWDDGLDADSNHHAVAMKLANKYGWLDHTNETLVGGGMPDGSYCWVFAVPQKSAAVGDWRDVAIDALQSVPDDPVRSAKRAIAVINDELEIAAPENPFAPFAKLGTWTREGIEFRCDGVPIFEVPSSEYVRGRKMTHGDVGDLRDALLTSLGGVE